MNFKSIFYFVFLFIGLASGIVFAEEKKNNKNSSEENLPLNNPFAGSAGISSATTQEINAMTAKENNTPSELSDYVLSGVVTTAKKTIKNGFISLVNKSGNYRILSINEFLNDNLSLIDITNTEAVFRRVSDQKELLLNFRGQVRER